MDFQYFTWDELPTLASVCVCVCGRVAFKLLELNFVLFPLEISNMGVGRFSFLFSFNLYTYMFVNPIRKLSRHSRGTTISSSKLSTNFTSPRGHSDISCFHGSSLVRSRCTLNLLKPWKIVTKMSRCFRDRRTILRARDRLGSTTRDTLVRIKKK